MTLVQQLQSYIPHDSLEAAHLERIVTFLQHTPRPFHRETLEGHITGSAIVVDPTFDQLLLLHHRQLDRWLQPGGHCDGNSNPLAVAMTEVWEETGLTAVIPVCETIFDIDVHRIPEKANVAAHWHYDIRYLFATNDRNPLQKSEREAIDLKWFPLSQLYQINPDESLRRVKAKLQILSASRSNTID